MDTCSYTVHPRPLERITFFLERLLRMQQVGYGTTYGGIGGTLSIASRRLTETEVAESELIGLSSAVWHLQYGETTSCWSKDSYLGRLVRAKPERRLQALEEHHLSEADYQDWLRLYSEPPAAAH